MLRNLFGRLGGGKSEQNSKLSTKGKLLRFSEALTDLSWSLAVSTPQAKAEDAVFCQAIPR